MSHERGRGKGAPLQGRALPSHAAPSPQDAAGRRAPSPRLSPVYSATEASEDAADAVSQSLSVLLLGLRLSTGKASRDSTLLGRGTGQRWEGGRHTSSRPQLVPAGGTPPRNGPGCIAGTGRAGGRSSSGEHSQSAPGKHGIRDRAKPGAPRGLGGEGHPPAAPQSRRAALALLLREPGDQGPDAAAAARPGMDQGKKGPGGRGPQPWHLGHLHGAGHTRARRQVWAKLEFSPGNRPPEQSSNRSPGSLRGVKKLLEVRQGRTAGTCLPGGRPQCGGSEDRDPQGLLRPVGGQHLQQPPQHLLLLTHSLIRKGNASAPGNSTSAHIKVTHTTGCPGKRTSPSPRGPGRDALAGLEQGKPAEARAPFQGMGTRTQRDRVPHGPGLTEGHCGPNGSAGLRPR